MSIKIAKGIFCCLLSLSSCLTLLKAASVEEIKKQTDHYARLLQNNDIKQLQNKSITIKNIVIQGNNLVSTAIIKNSIPYKEGSPLILQDSKLAIHNLYSLGHFRQIQLEVEPIDDTTVNLYVIVDEKKILENLEIKGNNAVPYQKIKEKFKIDKLSTIDEETLRQLALGIKKLYAEENRHFIDIKPELIINNQDPQKASAILTIEEGPKSLIKYVHFKGNKHLSERQLRNHIFTRENWLLSFTDSAGTYNQEALEADRHRLEYLYRDHGYLTAKIAKVDTEFSADKKNISVTFHIKEGNQFIVRNIFIPGDDVLTEEQLTSEITLEKGKPYSQSKLLESMNKLRDQWGEKGYIYANVYPQVKPDETTNEVDITFIVDKGNKLYTNRITITGNTVTKDKVIRRQLDILEGDLITTKKLNKSKAAVEYLSFFERDGVNWKIHRLADELADLELNVREAKTGQFNLQFTYGSEQYSSKRSLRGMLALEKRNLFGEGWDVGGMIEASRHRLKRIESHFFDPHFLDSNVSAGFNFYKRWDEYDQWRNVEPMPIQKVTGGNVRFGVGLPWIDKRLHVAFDFGIEDIKNNNPKARSGLHDFEPIVRRTFQKGTLAWLGIDVVKDTRNHQIYPNKGYKLTLSTKIAPPNINNQFGFIKTEAQGSCYTSLIGTDSLVLAMQLKLGHIGSLDNKIIPYKELFHMGGQTTVRGHIWGGIGPAWKTGDPLGAKNAAQFNTELIFPLIEDYSMKGHFFYDAGAGWHTPTDNITNLADIQRNKFDLRHSAGFGLNLLKPFPAKIDWGFKLDRKKHLGESPHEFHITMNYAW